MKGRDSKHHFPSQAAAVLRDTRLAMHAALQNASADPLLKEARVDLFESLFARLLKPSPQVVAGTLTPRQLLRVRDFMEARLCDKILLEDLALLLGLDRFRFLKLFLRTAGMPTHGCCGCGWSGRSS